MSLVVLQPCDPRGTSDPACRKQPIRSPLTLLFAPPTLCPCVYPVLLAGCACGQGHAQPARPGLAGAPNWPWESQDLPWVSPSEACGRPGSGPEIHKQKSKESASQLCCWHRQATAGSSQAGGRKSRTPRWGLRALTSPALGSRLAGTVPAPSLCLAVPVTGHAFPGLPLALPTWPWLPPSRPFSGPHTQDTSHCPVSGCVLCFLLLPMKRFERKDKGRENMRV